MYQYIHYNNIMNSLVHDRAQFMSILNTYGLYDMYSKPLEFIDYALEHGVEKAYVKYNKYFSNNNVVQQSLFGNGV